MATTEEPIRLGLKRRTRTVELEDDSSGVLVVRTITVRELDGLEKDEYENLVNSREKNADGNPKDVKGLSEHYLHLALREGGDKIPLATINSWKGTVRDELFLIARGLNLLSARVLPEKKDTAPGEPAAKKE